MSSYSSSFPLFIRAERFRRQYDINAFENCPSGLAAQQFNLQLDTRFLPRASLSKSPLSDPKSATAFGFPLMGLL